MLIVENSDNKLEERTIQPRYRVGSNLDTQYSMFMEEKLPRVYRMVFVRF